MTTEQDFDLNNEIALTYAEARRRARAEREDKERQARQTQEAIAHDFREAIKDELGQQVYDALGIEVRYVQEQGYAYPALGECHDGDRAYQITLSGSRTRGSLRDAHPWHIRRLPLGYSQPAVDVERGQLRSALLAFLGAERAKETAQQEQRRRDEQKNAVWEAEERERRHREEERKRLAQEAYEQGKARAEAEVAAAVAKAQEHLFRWPEGRTLTLYAWRWCTALASEDGGAEYESGWSTTDRLDGQGEGGGYVTLYSGSWQRRVRLLPAWHLPVVAAWVFTSVQELPADLVTTRTITVPLSDPYTQPGTYYTGYQDVTVDERRDVEVGREPQPWIQDLLRGM